MASARASLCSLNLLIAFSNAWVGSGSSAELTCGFLLDVFFRCFLLVYLSAGRFKLKDARASLKAASSSSSPANASAGVLVVLLEAVAFALSPASLSLERFKGVGDTGRVLKGTYVLQCSCKGFH